MNFNTPVVPMENQIEENKGIKENPTKTNKKNKKPVLPPGSKVNFYRLNLTVDAFKDYHKLVISFEEKNKKNLKIVKSKWFYKHLETLLLLIAKKTDSSLFDTLNTIWKNYSIFITNESEKTVDISKGVKIKKVNSWSFNFNTHITICECEGVLGYSISSPQDKYSKSYGDKKSLERLKIAFKIIHEGKPGYTYRTMLDRNGHLIKKLSGFIVSSCSDINTIKT